MILVGYQGIGKSSLAGSNGIIDLESGNFWNEGKRPDDWYIYYCNIAEHLSQQGYTVFTSSHEAVRNRLRDYSNENVCAVMPSESLKDEWIKKLEDRYIATGLEKDYKALANAKDRYIENIQEIKDSGIAYYLIEDMNYRLSDVVDYIERAYES